MGGEIGIVEKEIGERGTCFRFNVFLTACETSSTNADARGDTDQLGDDSKSGSTHQNSGLTIRTPSAGLTMRTSTSPRLTTLLSPNPRLEGSHVVLLIHNEERRRTSKNFMQSLGINVSVVKQWDQLPVILKKMKFRLNRSLQNSSGKIDFGYKSNASSASSKDAPLSAMEGTEQKIRFHKRRGAPGFILIVVDATAGPFFELHRAVTDFRKDLLNTTCKVVWLDKPTSRSIQVKGIEEEEKLDPSDDVVLKPFHGSRLYQAIKLLPEFGGTLPQGIAARSKRENTIQGGKVYSDSDSSSSVKYSHIREKSGSYTPPHGQSLQQVEIQEEGSSSSEKSGKKKKMSAPPTWTHVGFGSRNSSTHQEVHLIRQTEIEEENGDPINSKMPLSGKKILVAEDDPVLRKVAMANLKQLGATVELALTSRSSH